MTKARNTDNDAELNEGGASNGLIEFLEEIEWTDTRWRLNRARDGEPGQPGRWLENGTGEITEDGIWQRYGGGDYVLNVKRPNEGWKRYPIAIEGAPVEKPARAGAVVAAAAAASDPLTLLRQQLEAVKLEQQIATLRAELRAATQPAITTPAPQPIDELALLERMLRIQRELAPPAPRGGESLAPERLLDMFEKGMEAAGRAEGHGDIAGVVREGLELARDLFARRTAPAAAAGSAPRIVRSPQLETAHELARFLERGIAKGTAPDELADAADTIFSDAELARMRLAGIDDVMRELAPVLSAHPLLAEAPGRGYVAQWLEQLRIVPQEPPAAASS